MLVPAFCTFCSSIHDIWCLPAADKYHLLHTSDCVVFVDFASCLLSLQSSARKYHLVMMAYYDRIHVQSQHHAGTERRTQTSLLDVFSWSKRILALISVSYTLQNCTMRVNAASAHALALLCVTCEKCWQLKDMCLFVWMSSTGWPSESDSWSSWNGGWRHYNFDAADAMSSSTQVLNDATSQKAAKILPSWDGVQAQIQHKEQQQIGCGVRQYNCTHGLRDTKQIKHFHSCLTAVHAREGHMRMTFCTTTTTTTQNQVVESAAFSCLQRVASFQWLAGKQCKGWVMQYVFECLELLLVWSAERL